MHHAARLASSSSNFRVASPEYAPEFQSFTFFSGFCLHVSQVIPNWIARARVKVCCVFLEGHLPKARDTFLLRKFVDTSKHCVNCRDCDFRIHELGHQRRSFCLDLYIPLLNEIFRTRLAALEVDGFLVPLWTIPPFASMILNHVQDEH